MFCTYITFYSGNKLPPFYIGWSSIENIEAGYKGSVSSMKYKKIWENEIKDNPGLFKTKILTTHNSKAEAKKREWLFLRKFKVHKNPLYINMAIQGESFQFDRTGIKFSSSTIELMRIKNAGRTHTPETKLKISKGNSGKIRSDSTKKLIGSYHRGKIETNETRLKKSLSHIGKKHSPETLAKISENSGRAKTVTYNEVTYPSMRIAAESLFPELKYHTAMRKLRKLL